ncbi:hypothetical protein H072_6338 [Dactylellina haptotyla CBS 200.50]|uniref:Rhodopsin domain-containing protein n=1 Tax=Dactylellina haptotyla (strain CBS 200.50) TaxID=1284197 RepID=S8AAH8_DACHA|nr:hypothetical protein H072_6338 [Dactylellina haptotyla CBS 200.50]
MISGPAAIKFEWAMLGLTIPFVLLRLYSRCWITRNASASDIVVVLTWLLFAMGTCEDYATYRLGFFHDGHTYTLRILDIFDDKVALVKILKISFTNTIPYYGTLWGIKLSLLLLYYKLIPESIPILRLALHITSVVIGASFIVVVCLNMFWCLPVSRNWSIDKADACFSYAAYVPYFVTAGLHLFTELMLLILPFPLLKVLNLTSRKRVEVGALFALGGLCIVFTIARIIEVGLSANVATVGVWSTVEQAIGIVVVCAPALRGLNSPPVPQSQVDLESGNQSIHGQGWWTAGRVTPKRRESGGAHEILPKAFLRFSNPHPSENAWETLPGKQPSTEDVTIIQRVDSADLSSSASCEELKITKLEPTAQAPPT